MATAHALLDRLFAYAGPVNGQALARIRRRGGEPALAARWGAIGETGYGAPEGLQQLLETKRFGVIAPEGAFGYLDRLRASGSDVAGVGRITWETLRAYCPTADASRLRLVIEPAQDVAERGCDTHAVAAHVHTAVQALGVSTYSLVAGRPS